MSISLYTPTTSSNPSPIFLTAAEQVEPSFVPLSEDLQTLEQECAALAAKTEFVYADCRVYFEQKNCTSYQATPTKLNELCPVHTTNTAERVKYLFLGAVALLLLL